MEARARKDLGMVSSVLSTGAAVVLPPGIVQAAVAPVIVLEVLFTTVVGSIQSMAAPLLALPGRQSAWVPAPEPALASDAWAAASRATGTRGAEHDT